MGYVIDYDVCAIIVAGITMGFYFLSPRLDDVLGKLFAVVGCLIISVSGLDIVTATFNGSMSDALATVTNMLYLIILHVLPCLQFYYMLYFTGYNTRLSRPHMCVLALPFVLELIFLLTSPFTGLAFKVISGFYFQGPLSYVLYLVAGIYMVLSLFLVVTASKRLPAIRVFASSSFIGLIMIAMVIQFMNPRYMLLDFAAAMSLLIMYIVLHSSAEVSDPLTRVYNSSALDALAAERFKRKRRFLLMGFSIDNFRHLMDIYGQDCCDELLQTVAKELAAIFGGVTARIYGDEFCVLLDRSISANRAS